MRQWVSRCYIRDVWGIGKTKRVTYNRYRVHSPLPQRNNSKELPNNLLDILFRRQSSLGEVVVGIAFVAERNRISFIHSCYEVCQLYCVMRRRSSIGNNRHCDGATMGALFPSHYVVRCSRSKDAKVLTGGGPC